MSKPIYRYLANRRWRSYKRLVVMQRISQMHVVPDVLPKIDPVADVSFAFGRRNVQPGQIVDSRISQVPPRLSMQVFDNGERLITIAVIDPDVPDVKSDKFDSRCHFLASNIPVSPDLTSIYLTKLAEDSQVILPWLPPFAQKGSSYHRIPIFILQQAEGQTIDVARIREQTQRQGFVLRKFMLEYRLKPVGVNMFRTQWDEGTAEVMRRAGVEGADIEYRRKRIEPLPYKKKNPVRYR